MLSKKISANCFRYVQSIKRLLRPPLHRIESDLPVRVLGTDYGGWPVIEDSLSSESSVYSFGVGQDISFDLALIAEYGCKVAAFDPTPRSMAWVESQNTPDLFQFYPVGLSDANQVLSFYAPVQEDFVSYSVSKRTDNQERVELPVKPLDEIMLDLDDTKIDFLKMDIEGSEYPAITDMIRKEIFPAQLCVEFHHGMFGHTKDQTREAVTALKNVGYRIHYVSSGGREYGFHRSA
jgi:FkbM family methyltransferase